jgi:three-Cys-motif partner protein
VCGEKMPLPDDSLEKWEYKEHTRVKHEILSKYLGTWTKILGKFHNLNIFDCFAGRGGYPDGAEGSPLIVIKTIAEIREKMGRPDGGSCIFIERNKNNFQNLQSEINIEIENSPQKYGDWLKVKYFGTSFYSGTVFITRLFVTSLNKNHISSIVQRLFIILW